MRTPFVLFAFALLPFALAQGPKTIEFSRVVDLSHTISGNIPLWPGDPPVELEAVAQFDPDGYYLRRFSMGEHSATHMNAPNSFHDGAHGIDGYEPDSLVVPAVVVDVRAQADADPDHQVSVADLKAWEEEHGRIPEGAVVLAFTGWQELWGDADAFFGEDADGNMHFPGFSGEAAAFLLEERSAAGVGIDTHGVDPGLDEEYAVNTQVLAVNGIVLENLTNLDQLPAVGTTIAIGILRLEEGSGSPVSVLAFVP